MREQLKAYIDKLFEGTLDSAKARDFHDELLQNTLDRFDDECQSGKSEQEAYRIAVRSLGDPAELLKPFYPKRENTNTLRTVGIILYITSVVPVILLGALKAVPSTLGTTLMFWMIAAATALMILSGRAKPSKEAEQARMLRAIGVALIIASVSAVLIGAGYDEIRIVRLIPVDGAVLGVCGMFCMIAAGIVLIVTAAQKDHTDTVPQVPVTRTAPQASADSAAAAAAPQVPEMQPAIPKGLRIAGGILTGIYWVLVVMTYLSVSFSTDAWLYTWLIFVFAGSIYDIVKGIVRLCCGLPWLGRVLDGVIGLCAGAVFYRLTVTTGLWMVTWLVFPISACLQGIVSGIITLVKTSGKESIQ